MYEYWSLYNKERYEYRSVCNMEDLSDRDPYVSHVWNTDRHAFAAKQLQMKIFGAQFVFEIVFMQ